jgi:uncharacterized protein (TIGR00251 family)
MIRLESHPLGFVLPVRAQPGARRDEIRGEQDGALKVAVTKAPEKGKANRALVELLARCLKLRKSQIVLLSGETSSNKRFLLQETSLEHLRQVLVGLESTELREGSHE